ncbi:FmdB family zinc ribbon protein [Fundidesulfovibrio terrae]|uniref:FmdB family zinc ribbon protein n=1 Tax=Fundidesulfovibrio terrae TaxID=2922866 RepID=UPI001FAF7C03|nr:zinc ribbon domain-containing protein [Fundidesulfovibrio terrae]
MPIYEYRCQECQQTFEEWQKDFADRQVPCPVCGGKAERLISSSSFVLKGGGWYSDLYSKPAGSNADTCAPASSTSTKTETKACAASCPSGGCSN